MNPKTIGTYIANTRADIEARVARLSGIEQHLINCPAGTNDPSNAVADMLDAALSSQLSNAMERLRALNGSDMDNVPECAEDVRSVAVVDLSAADYKVVGK